MLPARYPSIIERSFCSQNASNSSKILLPEFGPVASHSTANYNEFARVYYHAYIEDMPDDCLPDEAQRLFFGTLQELIDWTDHAPDSESRADGWIDEPTYRARALDLREAYRKRFGL